MSTTLFLTGATGCLGAQIARRLLAGNDVELCVLVRASDEDLARIRLRREWWDSPDLREAAVDRVRVVAGDITLPRFGLDSEAYDRLIRTVTLVIHSAADVRLFEPLDDLRAVNVEGTRRALELAFAAHADHGLARFSHISTAYVAGKRNGPVSEEELSDRYGFSSPYEQSKYEAELLVREAGRELPVSVFRPGMIVGDSETGAIRTFNTLYYPLRLYLTKRQSIVPASPDLPVSLIPVDYVADAVARLTLDPEAAGLTFHLTPPPDDRPTLRDVAEFTRLWAAENMGLDLPRLHYLPRLARAARSLERRPDADLAGMVRLLPYFQHQPDFRRANTDRLLGPYPHRWRAILPPLLAYAVHYRFWHRSTRTAYEQVLYRLQSRRRPIVYHDLVDGTEVVRTATEVRAEILGVTRALRALGIGRGDRVAMTGLNSTRYFSILIGCGLSGVVTVPLYSTCPPVEIDEFLKDSGSRLLFVGAPAVLDRLSELGFHGPVVSFCPPCAPGEGGCSGRKIVEWAEFLTLGEDLGDGTPSPGETGLPLFALDDIATFYYTSGTTGRAKGVLFRHEQLRWLGETMASMYPWHTRSPSGSYLGYLPMNHVVEGIIASFSIYYVPAAFDIYYLDHFTALQQALTIARPTIFFSVPRFFEKVREAVLSSPLGQRYQNLPDGLRRSLLRRLLKRALLRRTGLVRCTEFVVGSASSALDVLQFYRDLGIEVLDAYGMTEAPLISLNPRHCNRPGTCGRSISETEIRVLDDGEVQVGGPQLAAGYWIDGRLEPFSGGWLSTGDLGRLDADGYLTLSGRKKDLIITSYGGNIAPEPIEARLRSVSGVSEAMLIGEARPFCAALLWLERQTWDPAAGERIDTAMAEINAHLAHPEQVKRWVVLPGNLTVENGALTGSMKIRRALVAERFAPLIDALYAGQDPPDAFYCRGTERT